MRKWWPTGWASFGLLLLSLVTVVGLAKMLSPTIERAVEGANAPGAVVGIVIAALVLFAAYLFLALVP